MSDEKAADVLVALVSEDPTLEGIIRELFATVIPAVCVENVTVSAAIELQSPVAIVDEKIRGAPGLGLAQEIRARGYRGGIILITPGPDAHTDRKMLGIGPAVSVVRKELVDKLPLAVAALAEPSPPGDELSGVQRDLRRVQQLVATGEAAMRIQHSLNNPLAALLAEAQLLELEPLTEEHLAAVRRIVELCRRMVKMVRGMETKPAPKSA